MQHLRKLVTKQKHPWESKRGKLRKVSINNNGKRGKNYRIQFYQNNGTTNTEDANWKAMKPSSTKNKHYHFPAQ